jgi:hypothetical protein
MPAPRQIDNGRFISYHTGRAETYIRGKMTYFKSYNHNPVGPGKDWGDLFELLSSLDSGEIEAWFESRAHSGFTMEEFVHFLNNLEHDEVQDWLWMHRREFASVLSRPSFNFDNSQIMGSDDRWQRVFFLSLNQPGDNKD